jgi:hypothetical protein
MRVLHLDSGREMRGGQVQVVRLIDGLLAAGVECTLLARRDAPLYREAAGRGWRVLPLSLWRTAVEARRHSVVHAHDGRSHTFAALVGGAPLVVARRVAFAIGSPWKYRRAARSIAVSGFVRQLLLDAGVPPERVAVVGDGVPLLPASDWSGGALALDNATDPAKGAGVAHQAATLGGFDLAFSRDPERDLAHARVFLYLTYSEGLGSAALLAMAAGVPVVASEVGGLPEFVVHRETGMLVDNQPQSVAGAVRILLEQPDLARRIAAAARRQVEERFSIASMVAGTLDVYRQVT